MQNPKDANPNAKGQAVLQTVGNALRLNRSPILRGQQTMDGINASIPCAVLVQDKQLHALFDR